ncbi:TetR/AcrR family transcriptional regulator [Amycolatopsis lurida]
MRRTQRDRSAGTKNALVTAARELFAERGYQAVPADEIVRAAGVSRGALYHHYGDKQGLFRAVVDELEQEVTDAIRAEMAAQPDFLSGLAVALTAFLDACARPEVRQISLIDGPSVLGWQAWRELEAQYGLGLIEELVAAAIEHGLFEPRPVKVLAQLVLSAVAEAALMIAYADDPVATRAEAEAALGAWTAGLLRDQNAGPLPK